jgi:hypothetical protein
MTGTMVLVLALCVASFAAGWFARGSDLEEAKAREARRGRRRRGRRADEQPTAEAVAEVVAGAPPGGIAAAGAPLAAAEVAPLHAAAEARAASTSELPRPGAVALRALDLATSAYEHAVDRWLDEGAAITPAGRATLGELDRAIRRLDLAIGRLDAAPGDHEHEKAEARIAIAALRDAAELLGGYRDGRAIDAAIDRQLRELEDEVAQARAALAGELA